MAHAKPIQTSNIFAWVSGYTLPYVEIDSVAEIFKEALKKAREISLKDDVEFQTLEGFLSMFMPVGQESKMDEILGIASKYDVF